MAVWEGKYVNYFERSSNNEYWYSHSEYPTDGFHDHRYDLGVQDDPTDTTFEFEEMVTHNYWDDDSEGNRVGTEPQATYTGEFVGVLTINGQGYPVVKFTDSGSEFLAIISDIKIGREHVGRINTDGTLLGPLNAPLPAVNPPTFRFLQKGESFTVCFFPGTLIATPSGERRVDDLLPGDPVLTSNIGSLPAKWVNRFARKFRRQLGFGRTVAVKWVGRQTVLTGFGPAERLMPVRIAAGSLGERQEGGNSFCRIAI